MSLPAISLYRRGLGLREPVSSHGTPACEFKPLANKQCVLFRTDIASECKYPFGSDTIGEIQVIHINPPGFLRETFGYLRGPEDCPQSGMGRDGAEYSFCKLPLILFRNRSARRDVNSPGEMTSSVASPSAAASLRALHCCPVRTRLSCSISFKQLMMIFIWPLYPPSSDTNTERARSKLGFNCTQRGWI